MLYISLCSPIWPLLTPARATICFKPPPRLTWTAGLSAESSVTFIIMILVWNDHRVTEKMQVQYKELIFPEPSEHNYYLMPHHPPAPYLSVYFLQTRTLSEVTKMRPKNQEINNEMSLLLNPQTTFKFHQSGHNNTFYSKRIQFYTLSCT